MGATLQSAKSVITLGSTLSNVATGLSVGLLAREGYQAYNGQMDGDRFGYHVASVGSAIGIGAAFGGPAGAATGLGAKGGEMMYDTSKSTAMTLNGQWNTFVNTMMSGIMQFR